MQKYLLGLLVILNIFSSEIFSCSKKVIPARIRDLHPSQLSIPRVVYSFDISTLCAVKETKRSKMFDRLEHVEYLDEVIIIIREENPLNRIILKELNDKIPHTIKINVILDSCDSSTLMPLNENTSFTKLELINQQISHNDCNEYQNFTSIEEITFRDCKFNADYQHIVDIGVTRLSETSQSFFCNFKNLKSLSFIRCNLMRIPITREIASLTSLTMTHDNLHMISMRPLKYLPHLKHLKLESCNLTIVPEIPERCRLETLSLANNYLGDSTDFSHLMVFDETLTFLNLSFTLITRFPERLYDLSNLEYVDARFTKVLPAYGSGKKGLYVETKPLFFYR